MDKDLLCECVDYLICGRRSPERVFEVLIEQINYDFEKEFDGEKSFNDPKYLEVTRSYIDPLYKHISQKLEVAECSSETSEYEWLTESSSTRCYKELKCYLNMHMCAGILSMVSEEERKAQNARLKDEIQRMKAYE